MVLPSNYATRIWPFGNTRNIHSYEVKLPAPVASATWLITLPLLDSKKWVGVENRPGLAAKFF